MRGEAGGAVGGGEGWGVGEGEGRRFSNIGSFLYYPLIRYSILITAGERDGAGRACGARGESGIQFGRIGYLISKNCVSNLNCVSDLTGLFELGNLFEKLWNLNLD